MEVRPGKGYMYALVRLNIRRRGPVGGGVLPHCARDETIFHSRGPHWPRSRVGLLMQRRPFLFVYAPGSPVSAACRWASSRRPSSARASSSIPSGAPRLRTPRSHRLIVTDSTPRWRANSDWLNP